MDMEMRLKMDKNMTNKSRPLSDNEIKKELTNMLVELDKFLESNHFNYSIFAGTLLGAIRHKGFIPWDDDLDIAMLRPEYELLLQKLRSQPKIGDNLTAIGFELGNGDLPYIKIINSKIKTEEYISPNSKQLGYLWIDVFPLDGIPENNVNKYYKKLSKLEEMYLGKRIYINKWDMNDSNINNIHIKHYFKKIKNLFKFTFINFNFLTKRYINFGKKYKVNLDKKITNNIWGIGYKEAFPAKYMTELTVYKFENIYVKGIKEADKWLTIRYGDYMKLPNEEDRINHGLKAWKIID